MCQEMVKQSKQKTIQERAQELQNVFAQDYQRYADKQMQPFNTMIARDLTEVGQTGANCGCYAAGMAMKQKLWL